MFISVKDMLDIGAYAQGKMPDIYWGLGLSGSETKILKYLWDNCLRIYLTLGRVCPKDKDGTPRFWRPKERMARECKVSLPTFRNAIRHMAEMGLVTSMDFSTYEGDPDTDDAWVIRNSVALSTKFLTHKDLDSIVDRYEKFDVALDILYDRMTVALIKDLKNLFPRNLKELEEDEAKNKKQVHRYNITTLNQSNADEDNNPDRKVMQYVRTPIRYERTPIRYERTPIKVGRTPVKGITRTPIISSKMKSLLMMANIKEIQKSMYYIKTPYEREVLKLVEYYEYKCRKALHSTGYRAIGKHFRESKNWKFFTRIYDMCKEHKWNYKIYIDAQFDRVKYWNTHKQAYPYPNQFTSEGAQKYFHSYIKNYKESYSVDGSIKVKPVDEVKSVKAEIIDVVAKDCLAIQNFIKRTAKQRCFRDLTEQERKMLYIRDHYPGLSAQYLSHISWILQYLNMIPHDTCPWMKELIEHITKIQNTPKLVAFTKDVVQKTEKMLNLPPCFED